MSDRTGQPSPTWVSGGLLGGIQGVVFDCDGVLIDSREANIRFYNLILEALSLPPMKPESEEFVHCHTVQESIAHIVPEGRYEEALEAAKDISYSRVLDHIRLQPGLVGLLETLQHLGRSCAVNTNRTNTIGLILDRFDLGRYFDPVVTANMVRQPKPHPESLLAILEQWDLSRDRVVFIGDTWVDEQTASSAGVAFWAYRNNELQAGHVIWDYADLEQRLQAESKR
jgi:phosphoglycolate phosphatase-like HAD superfamily hydrolase